MNKSHSPFLALAACSTLLGVAAISCAPIRMAVPQGVGGASDEIAISDRSSMSGALANESFKMGPYQVVDVSRKWNSSDSTTIAGFSSEKAKGGYTFGLKAPEGAYKGTCASPLER